jgi:hypothetical protein
MLGLSQSVVGDTAMPPDDWRGSAKAFLSPSDYSLWKTGFIEVCQEQANHNLAHGLLLTAEMQMGREPFEGVDINYIIPIKLISRLPLQAWQELPTKAEKTLELASILQDPDEPYQEFVAHPL